MALSTSPEDRAVLGMGPTDPRAYLAPLSNLARTPWEDVVGPLPRGVARGYVSSNGPP